MSKIGKILVWGGLAVIALLLAVITFTVGWRPFLGPKIRPVTARKFQSTTERLERGRYLFTAVTGCAGCHSSHDLNQHGAPILPGTEGAGEIMPFEDLPGVIVASNITPDKATGVGSWSDDELARAIREGIGRDGRALFPMMPYQHFRSMSDEDLASLIVYMRSIPAVRHELPQTTIIFPVKYLVRSAPQPVTAPVAGPDMGDQVSRGRYLRMMASCDDCHTPEANHQKIPDMEMSGGLVMRGLGTVAATANLTPDASGIGYYDEALFMQALRTGYVKARKISSIMPFQEYKNMTDDDLKDLFVYLKTLKPVRHRVDNSLPPTYCKLCKSNHGAGDQN